MQTSYRSDRKKNPTLYDYQEFTFDDLKCLSGRVKVLDQAGKIAEVKITSIKTWKRRPLDLDIHCKYGLYDYFICHVRNGLPDMTFIELI